MYTVLFAFGIKMIDSEENPGLELPPCKVFPLLSSTIKWAYTWHHSVL